jgi:transposase
MPRMSKVELFAAIRRDSRAGMSGRAIANKYRVSRHTVSDALTSAWPRERKPSPPRPSVLDPFKTVIDDLLRADLDAPRKQRHTAKRIYDRLIDEHGMHGVSYQVVRGYVAERKPKIRAEAGRGPVNVFLPQTHRPGEEAEVDFGEVVINLRGEPVTCMLFSLRLSFSGKAVHRIFASGGTEAFLEGHVHPFNTLGGVPTGKIRYDNLKAAVAQVLGFSRQRVETARWTAFRSHYGIDAFYCQPGLQGAHEKGGVEAVEQPQMAPPPDEAFETGTWLTPRVDRFSQVTVRTNRYSVPVRLVGRQVRVQLHASDLVIYDGRNPVARHERLMAKSQSRLDLDHYLEALLRKPGALPGATALEQARAAGKFTPVHDAWWEAVRRVHGDAAGTRALIDVLLLHRHMPHDHVVAGLARNQACISPVRMTSETRRSLLPSSTNRATRVAASWASARMISWASSNRESTAGTSSAPSGGRGTAVISATCRRSPTARPPRVCTRSAMVSMSVSLSWAC